VLIKLERYDDCAELNARRLEDHGCCTSESEAAALEVHYSQAGSS